MTSSSGYLFGAGCTPGHACDRDAERSGGDDHRQRVFPGQGMGDLPVRQRCTWRSWLCVIGGKQGVKRRPWTCLFTFFSAILLWYLPTGLPGIFPVLDRRCSCAIVTTLVTMLFNRRTLRERRSVATIRNRCAANRSRAGISRRRIFSYASGITGYNVSDIETLMTLWTVQGIQVGSLLFAGLLISSLGAVMDVAMSIGSSMSEILAQNDSLSRRELWKAGIRVGRDMMGTDSNTLILAFAGGSLSMLLLDYAYDLPYLQIINSNNIGIAIMQGLSGSFGVVLSVPITVRCVHL